MAEYTPSKRPLESVGAIAPTGDVSGSGTVGLGANPSGIGMENGVEALNAYSTVQSITINYADQQTMRSAEDCLGLLTRVVRRCSRRFVMDDQCRMDRQQASLHSTVAQT